MAESGGCGNTRSGYADPNKRASFLKSIAGSHRIPGQEFTDCHRPLSLGPQSANFDRSAGCLNDQLFILGCQDRPWHRVGFAWRLAAHEGDFEHN